MEIVLVGAPGSGTLPVGRVLAERHGARFVDLTGPPELRADSISGLRVGQPAVGGGQLRSVIAADRVLADPSVRATLYRGRRVIWLDAPVSQLVERLRAARRVDTRINGDIRAFAAKHTEAFLPFYNAGLRVDASGSIADTAAQVEPYIGRPMDGGTLVIRAGLQGGLLELGEGILGASLKDVLERLKARRCVIVTSPRSRTKAEAGASVVGSTSALPVDIETLPDGEPAKLLDRQEQLFRQLARRQLERTDPLVAIGDDALLEAAIFAAAVWLRGAPLVTIPVTTLGLIDTAIGGKGGIDLPGIGRNLLGAIHQPAATILDIALVADESAADRRAALAEAVKYALLGDDTLMSLLESGTWATDGVLWPRDAELLELVERCALAKRRLVLLDERDATGVRAALNLGHTLSHALETATDYQLRHGEAVAYGLRAALRIGTVLGVTPASVAQRATRVLDRLGLAVSRLDVPVAEAMAFAAADKKRLDGRLRWVLVGDRGAVIRDDVPASTAVSAVAEALIGRAGRH
jgi:3-dehydroquinate synthetase